MIAKEFKYILAVAETQNITKAAEKLFISQPALSRYINNLENSLDIKLFNRIGGKLTLTEFGEYYVEAGRRIISIVDELESHISASDSTIRGTLKVGCPRRGAYILPPVLSDFFSIFPNVKFEMYETSYVDSKDSLLSGKIDLAILKEPKLYNAQNLEYVHLFSEELVLVTPANHPMNENAITSRSDCSYPWIDLSLFSNDPFILYKPGHPNRDFAEELLQYYGITPEHLLDTNNIEGALNLVQSGLGVCFSPALHAERCLQINPEASAISIFSVGNPVRKYEYCLAYRQNVYLTKYAREFNRLIKAAYAEY